MTETTVHGVLLRIGRDAAAVGVLLSGPPGCGKSRLGLELLSRGHALIADDAIYVSRVNDSIIGHAPKSLAGFIAVREAGVFAVEKLYGIDALAPEQRIDLVVQPGRGSEPFGAELPRHEINGVSLPVMRTRSLPGSAELIEAVAANHALKRDGFDAAALLAAQSRPT